MQSRQPIIATAESCTGGMVVAALTDIPGSSSVVDRGFVTYSNAAKQQMLGVKAETLASHGAVSEPVAQEMAEGALAHSGASLAVSITGIAGPGGSEHKPEGAASAQLAASARRQARKSTQDRKRWSSALGLAAPRMTASASRDHALALLWQALQRAPGP
ncbi:MAG: CinA family protein [Gemmobacter sp.]|nr:CinA family protein [Gemmobacter sp.]